jgi:ketosteroid isomerase-like protein
MRLIGLTTLLCSLSLVSASAFAQPSTRKPADPATAAIRQVLSDQQSAWNRGDIDVFMQGYNNSPETIFIGKTIAHGHAVILARYKKSFATRAAMGTLNFSDLDVKMLGRNYAVVTGKFHLARTAAGGGEAGGVFSLIFQHEPQGWRIILDHTTS